MSRTDSFLLTSLSVATLLLLWVTLPAGALAQSGTDLGPVRVDGGKQLTIGGLLQTDVYHERPDGDGFRVRSTRLRFSGESDALNYAVQLDFASSAPLLDAFVGIPLADRLNLTAGVFKTPFSGEILTGRPDLLFAERARVVNTLAPGRNVGITVKGTLIPNRLTATLGAFNGTPGLRALADDLLLYVGRINGSVPIGNGQLTIGTNAGYSVDESLPLPAIRGTSPFTGTRMLVGADARLNLDRWLPAGEVDTVWLDRDGRRDTQTPFGFYTTLGAPVIEDHQVLVRYDQYDADNPSAFCPTRSPRDTTFGPTQCFVYS